MKNGKLFGKINLIDFLVVVVLVLAVVAVAVFFLVPRNQGDTLIMKFRIEEVDEFVAKKVHVGDKLYDETYSIDMGYVTDVALDDSISYGEVVDGVYIVTTKEGYYSMVITGEVKGEKTELGAEIAGKKYGVGHTFVLRAGDAKLYLRVYDIMTKEQAEQEQQDTETTQEDAVTLQDVTVDFYTPEIENFILDNIHLGDRATETLRRVDFGKVTEVKADKASVYVETENGIVLSEKPDYASATVTVSTKAVLSEAGVEIDGRVFCVGDEVELHIGSSRVAVKIRAIH